MRMWVKTVSSWRLARPAVWCTGAGGALGLTAVTLSAFNAISAQQAIALALPAGVAITAGLINVYVPDSLVAWRRGFQQGCQACKLCQIPDVNPKFAALSGRPDRNSHGGA
jgi:hypothetical protein